MRALNLVFQLHQPYSLKAPEGGEHEYFGGGADFREANQKYYQPFFALLERNTQRYPGLKVSLLVSGTWLDQAELYEPDLVRRLQKLVDLKQVELIAVPYYYSLAAFYDKDEFAEQVALFRQKFEGKFSTKCEVFAAPGLMYHDRLAKWAEKAGFRGALAGDGAEILGFRSAGKVYDAAECEDFRVLFENGRMSRALMQGEDLVMMEVAREAEEEAQDSASGDAMVGAFGDVRVAGGTFGGARTVGGAFGGRAFGGARKRTTAAEFVRGRAGAVSTQPGAVASRKRMLTTGKKVYSAKKLQKELDMVCLRGNLVSLCLDAKMFGAHREEGVVACFDEFFMNWLKVPGNKFLTTGEVFEADAFKPTAEVSVKTTVKSRGTLEGVAAGSVQGVSAAVSAREDGVKSDSVQDKGSATGLAQEAVVKSGLARVEEVQYILPEGFRTSSEDKLYELRKRVLKTKNEDLKRDFQKLTTLDYAFQGDFEKVLEDLDVRVTELLPKPKKLRAENDGQADDDAGEAELTTSRRADELNGVTGDEEAEPENDYTVKVHRILKKASAERQARPPRPEDFELESGEDEELVDEEGDLEEEFDGGFDGDMSDEAFDDEAADDMTGEAFDGSADEADEMMDAFDAAEAEVQVIAQRMKRSRQMAEREFEMLAEAEVVSADGEVVGGSEGVKKRAGDDATKGAKKKARRRIVLD